MHHGRRLAVTAGATVLGLAAMSGVGHAGTADGSGSGSPLVDLVDGVTGAVGGLVGALTGTGGSSSPGSGSSGGGSGSTGSSGSTSSSSTSSSSSGSGSSTTTRTERKPATSTSSGGSGTSGSTGSGSEGSPASTPGKKKSGKIAEPGRDPVHLRLGLSPDLDLKKLTAGGALRAEVGLNTLLGPVGLKVGADGRLSAEDIAIGDPEADGGIDVGANVLGLEAGVGARGGAVVRPGEVGAGGDLDVCVVSCAPTPPPAPPAPPGGGGGGGGGEPPATPPLPPLPEPGAPAVPGLPALPIGGSTGQGPVAGGEGPQPPKDLPITGADSVSLGVIGLATVVIGAAAVASTRRRDRGTA